jgi:geranylgeranyl diphosphate synthase type II
MRYSLFNGGKRLRPVMLLEFCRMSGGHWREALPFACALEMVHVYSLIHDDLPCMDNDDFRRGKPACHKVYGESTALLAGSALLSSAFERMLRQSQTIPAGRANRAALEIARASGVDGIAGGQELDLNQNPAVAPEEIYRYKTAALFIAAAVAGCIIADAAPEQEEAARLFGTDFGLGFQYADDFADGETDERRTSRNYYHKALSHLSVFKETSFMEDLVQSLEVGQ